MFIELTLDDEKFENCKMCFNLDHVHFQFIYDTDKVYVTSVYNIDKCFFIKESIEEVKALIKGACHGA